MELQLPSSFSFLSYSAAMCSHCVLTFCGMKMDVKSLKLPVSGSGQGKASLPLLLLCLLGQTTAQKPHKRNDIGGDAFSNAN